MFCALLLLVPPVFGGIQNNYGDFNTGTLTSSVANTAPTLSITLATNAASFPTGTSVAVIYSAPCAAPSSCPLREYVQIELASGSTYTILARALAGTSTPTTWAAGSKISGVMNSVVLDEIKTELQNKVPDCTPGSGDCSLTMYRNTVTPVCDQGTSKGRIAYGTTGILYKCDGTTPTAIVDKTVPIAQCIVIPAAVAADDYPIFKAPYALTIVASSIHVYQIGATNVVGGLDECTGTNGVCTGTTAVDADITGTDGADVADDGALTNPGIASGNWIRWHTTSVSGTNTSLSVCFSYTID